MVWNTGSNSPGELEMIRNTSAVAACSSNASESSRVRRATAFRSASALRGLFPLRLFEPRGAGSRSPGDPDVPFLRRLTMIARPVGDQGPGADDQLHQLRPHKREQLAYSICAGVGRAKSGPPHSRRLMLSFRARRGSPTRHFDHPVYRACVAGAKICIVRIVAPRMLQALTPAR